MRARGWNPQLGRVTPGSGGGAPIAYTPAITWPGNTIGTVAGQYIKMPGCLLLWVSFVESAGTASATLTIPLPAGYIAVTQNGSLASGVGAITTGAGAVLYGLTAAAGGTSMTATATGSVNTWTGMFVVPTTS